MANLSASPTTFWQKIKAHKKLSIFILLVILGAGYYIYRARTNVPAPTQYILGTVDRGTLTVSVSGSGQVSASNQVDVKPQVSGAVTSVKVTEGQTVKIGQILATLDATDAYKTVRDASLSLDSAKISLAKLVQPADNLSTIQA